MCVYVCVSEGERESKRERKRERQKERHTQRERERKESRARREAEIKEAVSQQHLRSSRSGKASLMHLRDSLTPLVIMFIPMASPVTALKRTKVLRPASPTLSCAHSRVGEKKKEKGEQSKQAAERNTNR